MYLGKSNITQLKDNQIAGAATINPIVDFINGIRTSSGDYIDLNPNENGSLNIDLNIEALLALTANESLNRGFRVTVTEGALSCTAGNVYFADRCIAVPALASPVTCAAGYMLYARLTGSVGELVYGAAVTRTLQPASGGDPDRVTLPICTTTQTGGEWQIQYSHMGDFVFVNTPYFWISNYNSGAAQSLDHSSGGGLVWTTYAECE